LVVGPQHKSRPEQHANILPLKGDGLSALKITNSTDSFQQEQKLVLPDYGACKIDSTSCLPSIRAAQ